ncbi:hypothetical protein E7T09_12960 [Deinococcus sp. KSM4-11]|uniref:hypothetical protein n=1 Tax=Deinococcus sp. KSM4-11 TaxID=2568654 RepID=UPI0010A37370|nr:hypothetical protein [Deinococcus sp. KSM4-11]THF86134.1 hypothetical protein E7T09_12960 [Deinococcus sp. KSM4-11]
MTASKFILISRNLALVAVLTLAACGQPSSSNSNNGNGNVTTISDAVRLASINAVETKANELMRGGVPEYRQALVTFLRARPEFKSVTLQADGSISAFYVDGQPLLLATNREPDLAPASGSAPTSSSPLAERTSPFTPQGLAPQLHLANATVIRPASTDNFELPEDKIAVVMEAMGSAFESSAGTVEKALAYHGRYQVIVIDPTVDNLKTLPKMGVLYFSSHGAPNNVLDGGVLVPGFALWTKTKVDERSEIKYSQEIRDGFLVRMTALDRRSAFYDDDLCRRGIDVEVNCDGEATHYAVTDKFIEKYWKSKFSSNSFAFMDACSTAAVSLQSVLRNAGVATMAGWDSSVGGKVSFRASSYFFDRATGLNEFEKVTPPNRPFSASAIFASMAKHGIDTFESVDVISGRITTTKLGLYRLQGSFGILAPSIKQMSVNEPDQKLNISGEFGSVEKPTVTINGQNVNVTEWNNDHITISNLPTKDLGSEGDVIVKVGKLRSNAVPLTRWVGGVKLYTEHCPACRLDVTCDLVFRADVHSYRESEPDSVPTKPFSSASEANGSQCNYNVSSTGKLIVSGSGSLLAASQFPNSTNNFAFNVLIYVDIPKAYVGGAGTGLVIHYIYADGSHHEVQYAFNMNCTLNPPPSGTDFNYHALSLDSTFFIIGGTTDRGPAICESVWSSFTPSSPPDNDVVPA